MMPGYLLLVAGTIFAIETVIGYRQEKIPKDLYSKMMKSKSTADFLKSMNMYEKASKVGSLPSQLNLWNLKSRSNTDGVSIASMTNLDQQICKVRPAIHFLEQPPVRERAFVWPYAVKLPRCMGSCSVHPDILSCVAVNTSEIDFRAFKVYYNQQRKRRDVMEEFSRLDDPLHAITKRSASDPKVHILQIKLKVEESCDCKCLTNKTDCESRGKIFVKDFCRCDCPIVKNCTPPFKWDDDTCKCICGEPQSSKSHCINVHWRKRYWSESKCACVCYGGPNSCRWKNKVRNMSTCKCECTLKSCPGSKKLDRRRCRCR